MYLEGELAGGREDERGEVPAFGGAVEGCRVEDALQDGQRERQRLPGPCKIERAIKLRSIFFETELGAEGGGIEDALQDRQRERERLPRPCKSRTVNLFMRY